MKRLLKILLVCCAVFVALCAVDQSAIKLIGAKEGTKLSESGRYQIDFYHFGNGSIAELFLYNYWQPFFVKIYDLENNGRRIYTSDITDGRYYSWIIEEENYIMIGLGIYVPINR